MRPIRNSAKAIIVRDGCLLVTRNLNENGDWYLLPGGGQLPGETLTEALQRECKEEIATTVQIGDLKLVREYIGKNHEFAESDGHTHQVEFFFECQVDAIYIPHNGHAVDEFQTGVDWLPISDLDRYRLYPQRLKAVLIEERVEVEVVYLGDTA